MNCLRQSSVKVKSPKNFDQAEHNAKRRLGHLAVAGRWNCSVTKRLEDDFILNKKVLGTGVNGSVFSAKSRYTGERVAIKQLHMKGVSHEERKILAGEVEVFLSMDHPHVARLMGVYESDSKGEDTVSLVMEYLEGGELYDRVVQKKIFKEQDAAHATWQMLLAVNYLHHEGVTHRDLKLENFLYDAPGSDFLKLIDFGLSQFCEGRKFTESLGTLAYVAPEVLKRNYKGCACDLWSLGCITFILLFGYMPFNAQDGKLARLIVRGQYRKREDRWKNVSKDSQDFVQRLLVVKPEKRLTARQALAHPFITKQVSTNIVGLDASTADGFLSFSRADNFKKACLQVMAWALPLDERRKLRDAFITVGANHDGIVELDDLEELFSAEFNVPSEQLDCMMKGLRSLDADGDGELHYSDFLAGVIAWKLERGTEKEELLKETFRRFDVHDLGYITRDAFERVVGTRGMESTFNEPTLVKPGQMNVNEFIDRLRQIKYPCGDVETSEKSKTNQDGWLRRHSRKLVPSCMRLGSGNAESDAHMPIRNMRAGGA